MHEKIKVLFVLGSMHNGGTEVFVLNYFRELSKESIESSFLVVQGDEEYFKKEIEGHGGSFYHLSNAIDGNYEINPADIIGTSANEKVIGKVGGILKFLESKWGFLFIVLVPGFIIFLYEIYALIVEIKYGDEDEKEDSKK